MNAVCKIAVTLSPQGLLEVCQQIEHEMGASKNGIGVRERLMSIFFCMMSL
ncbi:6-hydroxymethyl-7,8-dihydropterin pyrophosphokinase [uncultured Thiomicrorhabdus sp.]